MDEVFVSEILVFKKCLWYNDGMKKNKHGFTLIEVAIFLAVTGALFAAITIGVQNSIYQQRYNDVVQNFADFLSNLYSEVVNVQSEGNGRSNKAIYGKLVTFGEGNDPDGKQVIYAYNVIADAINTWDPNYNNATTIGLMKNLHANVVRKNDEGTGYVPIGMVEEYTPRWAARIQEKDFKDYKGSLLILRSAQTGTVRTYASNEVIKVNEKLGLTDDGVDVFKNGDDSYLDSFKMGQVDFCVNPNGDEESNTRMDVRLVSGAHDASGVEIVSFDREDYRCAAGNN